METLSTVQVAGFGGNLAVFAGDGVEAGLLVIGQSSVFRLGQLDNCFSFVAKISQTLSDFRYVVHFVAPCGLESHEKTAESFQPKTCVLA